MVTINKLLVPPIVLCLCWTARLPGVTLSRVVVDVQEVVERLVGFSNQLNGNKGNGDDVNQRMLEMWSQIPTSLKDNPEVLACYGLVRIRHDVESYALFTRLANLMPRQPLVMRAHIYSAMKEQGATTSCGLINRYLKPALMEKERTVEMEEFTFWAVVLVESIKTEKDIADKLALLLDLMEYKSFVQEHDDKIIQKLADIGIERIQFKAKNKDAKSIKAQIEEADQILRDITKRYLIEWNNASSKLQYAFDDLEDSLPSIKISLVSPSNTAGLSRSFSLNQNANYYYVKPCPIRGTFRQGISTSFYDLRSGRVLYSRNFETDYLLNRSYHLSIANNKLQIDEIIKSQNNLTLLNSKLSQFLSDYTSNYTDAIKADAGLRAELNNWRQRLSKFNENFEKVARIDKRRSVSESRSLKMLGERLALIVDFSAKKELSKLDLN